MDSNVCIPRVLIAGTNSGCGKTIITTGIMAALKNRGFKIQPYKVGPDYIDPMFHTFITGTYSRNLDSWMLNEDTVSYLFKRNAVNADISIVEGMMGLFDGFGGHSIEGSTAHLAKIIKAPVILVVDCEGMALSIAALIQGFMNFDTDLKIKGVIINKVYNEGHYKLLKEIIESRTQAKVIGYLPKMTEFMLPDRHLGLVTSHEIDELNKKLNFLGEQIEGTVNINLLIDIANESDKLEYSNEILFKKGTVNPNSQFYIANEITGTVNSNSLFDIANESDKSETTAGTVNLNSLFDIENKSDKLECVKTEGTVNSNYLLDIVNNKNEQEYSKKDLFKNLKIEKKQVRIAIAMDKAFNFYYRDNLDLLEMMGAELTNFSPIEDKKLPENIDGIYIGGGYPEIWAKLLEENVGMRQDIYTCISAGMPIYAECGGLMYLSESIEVKEGEIYQMVGALPGKSKMTDSLQNFGYVNIEIVGNNILANKGDSIRAHEFHFSKTIIDSKILTSYKVFLDLKSSDYWSCGYKSKNLLAAYPHIHFWANIEFARNFVNNCYQFQKKV